MQTTHTKSVTGQIDLRLHHKRQLTWLLIINMVLTGIVTSYAIAKIADINGKSSGYVSFMLLRLPATKRMG